MRVLYICTGNSFRSPMAEALTRKHRTDWKTESAGTGPARQVAPDVHNLLKDEAADPYIKSSPEPISQRAIDQADLIVCMKPRHRGHILEHYNVDPSLIDIWDVDDPLHTPISPEQAYQEIREHVLNLPGSP